MAEGLKQGNRRRASRLGLVAGIGAVLAAAAVLAALVASCAQDLALPTAVHRSASTTTEAAAPGARPTGSVAAGTQHSCALQNDGKVYCWGSNGSDQLGGGAPGTPPTEVTGISNAVVLAAGWYHTCVVLATGHVQCWGQGGQGNLGNNSTSDTAMPGDVLTAVGTSLTGATAVACGGDFSCALTSDGAVHCWGQGTDYKRGVNSFSNDSLADTVVDVSGLTGSRRAVQVTTGDDHACALMSDGSVACWGDNNFGELGDGTQSLRMKAVNASGVVARAVAAGGQHTCALLSNGNVACWGRNNWGELGNGTLTTPQPTPTTVVAGTSAMSGNLANIVGIAAGELHTCAVRADGTVWCWGDNTTDELGYTESPNACSGSSGHCQDSPGQVTKSGGGNLSHILSIAAALDTGGDGTHTCGTRGDGSVWCWGDGAFATEVPNTDFAGYGANGRDVVSGENFSCALKLDGNGTVRCWGNNDFGELGIGSADSNFNDSLQTVSAVGGGSEITGAKALSASSLHACALEDDGRVACWGYNLSGQIGNNSTTDSYVPAYVQVGGGGTLNNVISISAGVLHSCAVLADGTAWCWGHNGSGELGNNTITDSLVAVQVSSLSDAVSIVAGEGHTCALRATGAMQCWGANSAGEIGNGGTLNEDVPTTVATDGGVATGLSAGWNSNCAIYDDASVHCWGVDNYYQLGDDASASESLPGPVVLGGSGLPVGVSGSAFGTCALIDDGSARCWGYNAHGQVGDGTTTDRQTPVAVINVGSIVRIATGVSHVCALQANGAIDCWGSNLYGELGAGTQNTDVTNSPSAQVVTGMP